MITVFGKEWFKKYNKQLCWLANSFVGDWIFKISKMGHDIKKYGKITEIHPNAITHFRGMFLNLEKHRLENKYTTQFFSRNEYALRLQKVFYPIWITFHMWDMLIANKFKPAWNLGFDTLTKYPGSTGSNDPVMGISDYTSTGSWATVRGASSATSTAYPSDTTVRGIRLGEFSSLYRYLIRSFFCFDTSALTSGATISGATLSLSSQGSSKANAMGDIDLHICSSTPANTNALVNDDYDQVGNTSFGNVTYANWNDAASTYNDITLNASGIANISKTGISQFGARSQWDINNSPPSITGSTIDSSIRINFNTSDYGPKLVVTYTTGTAYFQTCSATISINDTILNKTSRVFTEVISIVDSIAIQKTLSRTLSEAITIVDNLNAKKIAVKTFSEIISITDTIKMNISKVFSETIIIIDNLLIQKVLKRTLSETISMVDSIEKSIIKFKTLVENISIVDSITKKTSRVFTETVTIVSTLSKQLIKIKIFSEAITITDSFSIKIGKVFTETISIISSFAAQTYKVARATIKYTGQVLSKLNNTEQIKAKIKKIINN